MKNEQLIEIKEHYEFYCIPDSIEPIISLHFKDALRNYDIHERECTSPKKSQVVRVVHGKKPWRDVMLP